MYLGIPRNGVVRIENEGRMDTAPVVEIVTAVLVDQNDLRASYMDVVQSVFIKTGKETAALMRSTAITVEPDYGRSNALPTQSF